MNTALEGSGQQRAPAALHPRERPGTHFTGGWVGSRAGLEGGKSRTHWDSIADRPARTQSLYQLSYPAHNIRLQAMQTHLHMMQYLRSSHCCQETNGHLKCVRQPGTHPKLYRHEYK